MHIDWPALGNYLYGNRVAIGSATMLALTAAVKTAPIPQNVYVLWAYDWFHQTLNITNSRPKPEAQASPK